jgi:hypothetical protein
MVQYTKYWKQHDSALSVWLKLKRLAILFVFCLLFSLSISWRSLLITTSLSSAVSSSEHNVFICITGQLPRLVLKKQMASLYQPMRESGYNLDFALVLTEGEAKYTNAHRGKSIQSEFHTFQQVVDFIQALGYRVLTDSPTIQSSTPTINEIYLSRMDKPEFERGWQRKRVENHARQFESLKKCYTTFREGRYDFAIRTREDVSFNETFAIDSIMPIPSKTIITSDCRTHGGLNDRIAFISADAAKDYFVIPHNSFLRKDLHKNIYNPESYFWHTYCQISKLRLVSSFKVRYVVKYVKGKDGQDIPAQNEDFSEWCPKDLTIKNCQRGKEWQYYG